MPEVAGHQDRHGDPQAQPGRTAVLHGRTPITSVPGIGCGSTPAHLRGARCSPARLLRRRRCCGHPRGEPPWCAPRGWPGPRRAGRPPSRGHGGARCGPAGRAAAAPAWRATARPVAVSAPSTLTPQTPDSVIASWNLASTSTQTSTSSGSIETDVIAFAVIAWSWPPLKVVSTVTPVANRPIARRNWSPSTGRRPVRRHQRGRRPPAGGPRSAGLTGHRPAGRYGARSPWPSGVASRPVVGSRQAKPSRPGIRAAMSLDSA